MNIFIQAVDSGKAVRVIDRINSTVAFEGFLELADGAVPVNVASNDGQEGNIDIFKGLRAPPNVVSKTDYDVKVDEIVYISDGHD